MNTRFVMAASSILLWLSGAVLIFLSSEIIESLGGSGTAVSVLLAQITGALYIGFAMLNWMAKNSTIGGIYNRPIAVANFTHFFIATFGLTKYAGYQSSTTVVVVAAVYALMALIFGYILFTHPLQTKR